MRTTFEQQIAEAKSLLDVLLILKQKTMLDTHVATLAYLNEQIQPHDGKFGIWTASPFPLDSGQSEYRIQAYYFDKASDNSLKSGDIVVILFMDRNFINNLQSAFTEPKPTNDEIIHSLKYGVLIKSL